MNSQLTGFIAGLIGPVIGFLLYYLLLFSNVSFSDFISISITAEKLAAIISLSAIFNLIIFYLFIWKNKNLSARGVILATFVYVLIVILAKFTE